MPPAGSDSSLVSSQHSVESGAQDLEVGRGGGLAVFAGFRYCDDGAFFGGRVPWLTITHFPTRTCIQTGMCSFEVWVSVSVALSRGFFWE